MLKVEVAPKAAARGAFTRYAWAVLGYNVLVVLWGAFVRATGSGAGCGAHWPLCNGEVTPRAPALETIIEFTHRAMSGVDVVLVAALLIWALRAFPRSSPVRPGAILSTVFLMTEALLGAALVLLEHVARNANAYWSSAHLVNTLALLACLTLTAWWSAGRGPLRIQGRAAWMAGLSLFAVVLLGVTGVIAALGDTLFPARSVAEGLAQDLDPASNILLKLRVLHPLIALATAVWLLYYGTSAAAQRPGARRYSRWVIGVAIVQLAIGGVNWLLLAPVWVQLLHLMAADAVWISLVLLAAATLEIDVGQVSDLPSRGIDIEDWAGRKPAPRRC